MKLRILRRERPGETTIGELFIDGEYFCWVLEDVVRAQKIQDRTAIPAGAYKVILNFSNRFQRQMPLVLNVPDFTGIRIHGGNSHIDTKGCPLVGFERRGSQILRSQEAFRELMERLEEAHARGEEIWLEILQPEAWPKWQQRVTVSLPPERMTMPEFAPAAPPAAPPALPSAPGPAPAPVPAPALLSQGPISAPDDAPIRVVSDEGTARGTHWLIQVVAFATGAWAVFQNNSLLLVIMASVLVVVTVAWYYRSTVLNKEKMRINSDPSLFNVD